MPLCTTTKPFPSSELWGCELRSQGTPWVAQRVCAMPTWVSTGSLYSPPLKSVCAAKRIKSISNCAKWVARVQVASCNRRVSYVLEWHPPAPWPCPYALPSQCPCCLGSQWQRLWSHSLGIRDASVPSPVGQAPPGATWVSNSSDMRKFLKESRQIRNEIDFFGARQRSVFCQTILPNRPRNVNKEKTNMQPVETNNFARVESNETRPKNPTSCEEICIWADKPVWGWAQAGQTAPLERYSQSSRRRLVGVQSGSYFWKGRQRNLNIYI